MNKLQRLTLVAFCIARAFGVESIQAKPATTPTIFALAIAMHETEFNAHKELHNHAGIIECPKHTASIAYLKTLVNDREEFKQNVNRIKIFNHLETIKQEYTFQKNAYSQDIIAATRKATRLLIRIQNKDAKDQLFDLLTQIVELDEQAQSGWLK